MIVSLRNQRNDIDISKNIEFPTLEYYFYYMAIPAGGIFMYCVVDSRSPQAPEQFYLLY